MPNGHNKENLWALLRGILDEDRSLQGKNPISRKINPPNLRVRDTKALV